MPVITDASWLDLFDTFERTAIRLETQPAYLVDAEQEEYQRFLATGIVEDDEPDRRWRRQMRAARDTGRRVARVRFVTEPPGDYQRYLFACNRFNDEDGEDIRYLTYRRAAELCLPLADFWLFDDAVLLKMNFAEQGRPLDKELVDRDRAAAEQARVWLALAMKHATPYRELAREPSAS
ncbi:hypothetical protein DN069_21485 [Streptacidiphilus pinicola]|uniref:DUF6879 domain-containing protein n=1 Tax=Streptacidiphilus pinicola TaxID=2219663 RepID=A0A2X0K7R1_9ACTN|nr:DUF6879 family protein [Streptacidiphilus pinicola]RAG83569.1 hypothetical protein DN069_21485 [Streptacidiphilus pinicola]